VRKIVIRVKPEACKNCDSPHLVKTGKRYNQGFWVQRFRCKDCFVSCCDRTDEFLIMKSDDEFIEDAVKLHHQGFSSYQIEKKLNYVVSNKSIIQWIHKFVNIPKFQKNASHRKEVRAKISATLKNKHVHNCVPLKTNSSLELVSDPYIEKCVCTMIKYGRYKN